MQIGKYKLYSIQTGYFKLDGGAMFGVVPKQLWSKTNPSDQNNNIEMCMRSLLLVSDNKKILIDTGIGNKISPKFETIYSVNIKEHDLKKSIDELGFSTDDITDVILSHLHFDHCGGTTYYGDEKNIQLTFPNATHHIHRKQWEWAINPSERDKASYMPENYTLLKEKNVLNLIDDDYDFDEYISILSVNGHTPGQLLVLIQDSQKKLLYGADLLPLTSHIQYPYIMSYDLFPLTTLEEKKKILPGAEKENWIIFYEHDIYTETSCVKKTEKGFFATDFKKLSDRE